MNTVATGEGLIEDGYVTYYRVQALSYPVTIDVKYEKSIKSTLNIPAFRFIHPKEASSGSQLHSEGDTRGGTSV
ncbi:MAG: hypothetical protein WDO16_19315 [Bacteroidota bacterium]